MTSDETVTASTPKSSMMLGRATASIVELSGTSTEPLATPEHRRAEQPRPTRPGHRRRTIPVLPSSSTSRPSAIRVVASPVPTTAGRSNSRATTAACDRTPPVSVISPPAIANSGDPRRVRRRADDDVAGLDRPEIVLGAGSPGRGPRTIPAEAPVPRSSSGSVDSNRSPSKRSRRSPSLRDRRRRPCAAAGSPPNGRAPRGGRRRRRRRSAGRRSSSRDLVASQDTGRRRARSMTPAATSRPATRIDEAAQGRLRHPVDPVVVDLGQRADPAREPEQRLEAVEPLGVVGQPRAGRRPARTSASAASRSRRSSAPTGRRVLDPLGELGQEQVRVLGPRRHGEVVEAPGRDGRARPGTHRGRRRTPSPSGRAGELSSGHVALSDAIARPRASRSPDAASASSRRSTSWSSWTPPPIRPSASPGGASATTDS